MRRRGSRDSRRVASPPLVVSHDGATEAPRTGTPTAGGTTTAVTNFDVTTTGAESTGVMQFKQKTNKMIIDVKMY